ncbi:PA2G4 protein, partial [Rhadina sibilatrix]|nr:PA2G4 protein [Rhadina sibilatrix]
GVLRAVVEAANPGASVLCLCEKGDAMIMEETGKIFKKEKEMKKGATIPKSLDPRCHHPKISGFQVPPSQGFWIPGATIPGFLDLRNPQILPFFPQENPVSGRKADVIKAAHLCAEAALRLVKPGNQNTQVTEAWNKIAHAFHCTPI